MTSPRVSLSNKSDGLIYLPTYGYIDDIRLEENGAILTVMGWIAPPKDWTGEPIDQIVAALDLPVARVELIQRPRPDVVKAGVANYLDTGFTIRISLVEPLAAVPTDMMLCIAGSVLGERIVRTRDYGTLRCR